MSKIYCKRSAKLEECKNHQVFKLQAIEIRLVACSGEDFGNVTVKTPFSIDALIWSSCKAWISIKDYER